MNASFRHNGVGAKVRRDGRQRRGNHRRVHVFHEQGRGHDEWKQAGWGDHFYEPENAKLWLMTQ